MPEATPEQKMANMKRIVDYKLAEKAAKERALQEVLARRASNSQLQTNPPTEPKK